MKFEEALKSPEIQFGTRIKLLWASREMNLTLMKKEYANVEELKEAYLRRLKQTENITWEGIAIALSKEYGERLKLCYEGVRKEQKEAQGVLRWR